MISSGEKTRQVRPRLFSHTNVECSSTASLRCKERRLIRALDSESPESRPRFNIPMVIKRDPSACGVASFQSARYTSFSALLWPSVALEASRIAKLRFFGTTNSDGALNLGGGLSTGAGSFSIAEPTSIPGTEFNLRSATPTSSLMAEARPAVKLRGGLMARPGSNEVPGNVLESGSKLGGGAILIAGSTTGPASLESVLGPMSV
jgi:hypothetical protein